MSLRGALAVVLAIGLVAAACGDDDGETAAVDEPTPTAAAEPTATATPEPTATPGPTATPTATPEPRPELVLDLPGLPPLRGEGSYEAWLVVDDQPVSAGSFDMPAGVGGTEVRLALTAEPEGATAVIVTVETDQDPAPSASRVLAGPIADGQATLTVGDPLAIGVDFGDAAGTYILATPTDGDGSAENERSGIWWTFIPRAQSLFLPELPEGWIYEGWQIIDEVAVSTGTFTVLFGEPDHAAPYSGPQAGPPFPGEDFLQNAPEGLTFPHDLRGTEVAISVESVPDTGPGSFPLIPLMGGVPADALDHTHYELPNIAAHLPLGTAVITSG